MRLHFCSASLLDIFLYLCLNFSFITLQSFSNVRQGVTPGEIEFRVHECPLLIKRYLNAPLLASPF